MMVGILSLLILLSGFLRFPGLDRVPPELFGDEIDVGYQAYALLKTGKDIYRQTLPTYVHSLAEWRAPLLMYATVPTLAVFGTNAWGVRLPEAIFGTLAPLLLFLLTKNKWAVLALAIMPWHIHYSRAAFEVVIMLDLVMLGTLLFLKRRFIVGYLFFALAMYTYSTAILFVPLWLLYLKPKKELIVFGVLILPLVYQIVLGPARGRFGTVNVTQDTDLIDKIFFLRHEAEGMPGERLFHNRLETFGTRIFTNYLESFSTNFLLIQGDPALRHNIQVTGELLAISIVPLLLGLYVLVKYKSWLWLVWLILAPLPAVLTTGGGHHATRLFLMTVPLAVAIGTGLAALYKSSRLGFVVICLVGLGQLVAVGHYYWVHYPKSSWRWWHVGYQKIMTDLKIAMPQYTRVFINNTYEPALPRFLFWTGYAPMRFQQNFALDQVQKDIIPQYDGFSLEGKYFFGAFSQKAHKDGFTRYMLPNALYVISQRDEVAGDWDLEESPPAGIKVLAVSRNPYGQPILYLVAKE